MERLLLEEVTASSTCRRVLPLMEVVPGDVVQEITVANNEVTRTVQYAARGIPASRGGSTT